jgi:GT2 family glycosyltransferase/glycosyltransferase involved in cell wall biosynthesis
VTASPPEVLLDATAIPRERGGAGRYVEELAAALDPQLRLAVACQAHDAETFARRAPAAEIVPLPARFTSRAARLGWEQTGLPVLTRRLRVPVVHSPHYTMPVASPVPVVVTLHDATFFSDRDVHLDVKGRFFRFWSARSLRHAAGCIVPSRATATELARWVPGTRAEITVAYHGVDPAAFHPPTPAELAEAIDALDLPADWIAFLGTLEPRKNLPALIRGYSQAFGADDTPPALVLAGGKGWDDEVADLAAAVRPPLRVTATGFVDGPLLPGLLGGAKIVAYPSLGEGFGLPVLEAMACGAAVLTTRELALPEVGGDAVEYCGTRDTEIGAALAALAADPDRRQSLAAAALERAATFTWEACAEQHVRAYRRAARADRTARPPSVRAVAGPGAGAARSGAGVAQPSTDDHARSGAAAPAPPARLGVVVVTYSPGETLAGFLDSLATATTVPVQIVLADNGSTDGSVELAGRRPGVTVLDNGENLGFGGAANRGVAALDPDIDLVLIANPDLQFDPGSVDELLAVVGGLPTAGAFGPAIRTPEGGLYPSARRLPSLLDGAGHAVLGWIWPANPWTRRYRAEDVRPGLRPAGWLSGACLLVRRSAFEQVGGFDERYFMYFEDIDLADRLGRAGWASMYVPAATVEHLGGHATVRNKSQMVGEHHRSAYRYLADRHAGPWRAPLRWSLRIGLAARAWVAMHHERVAAGAAVRPAPPVE